MKLSHIISVIFLVAVICIQSGFGIKCYECNSFHQQDCGDHFQNTTFRLVTCEGDLCRKIVQTVKIDDKWQARYIRQCAKDGEIGAREGRECKDRIGTNGIKMRYCHCNNMDGCNSANSWNVPFVLMTTAFVGQYIWQKL
ncbi:Hypothetical predicted protein [Octopus vulgaris]|uniref:Uncharacterized protein n=2 Tax=Octopus TaxID=6643 RepID=A0AA36F3A9_OCTVU|nr:uncharacterized protein LOC115211975 [Octopus sinensis]CAI9722884.1 Hypothetical predicted protein [Octopus vulgaris]